MKLRQAAEMALQYFEDAHGLEDTEVAIKEALRQALAQPEQEPVAWAHIEGNEIIEFETDKEECEACKYCVPLYTAPPKKQWVGLTDEEIKEIIGPWGDTPVKGYTRKLFDQIEAKLREKNA